MSTTASPYGLKPVNLIGGQLFNGGVIREYALTSNNSAPIFFGDMVKLTAGVPSVVAASPTAGTTAGIVGVCVGVRYQLSGQQLGYPLYAQYLPVNSVTAGYTNIFIRVMDDPDAIFQVQANGAVTAASIGKNIAFTTASFTNGNTGATGNTTTGNSVVSVDQSTIATTSTLAMRIVDLVNESSTFGGNFPSNPGDAYTDCLVKFNLGTHSYYLATGN